MATVLSLISVSSAIGLGALLVVIAFRFMKKMKESGAKVWQQMAESLMLIGISLILAECMILATLTVANTEAEDVIMLLGYIFWLGAGVFAYTMIGNLTKELGRMLS